MHNYLIIKLQPGCNAWKVQRVNRGSSQYGPVDRVSEDRVPTRDLFDQALTLSEGTSKVFLSPGDDDGSSYRFTLTEARTDGRPAVKMTFLAVKPGSTTWTFKADRKLALTLEGPTPAAFATEVMVATKGEPLLVLSPATPVARPGKVPAGGSAQPERPLCQRQLRV